MSDLISRQKAVCVLTKMMKDCFPESVEELDAVVTTVYEMPSAESESSRITILHRKIDLLSILQAIKSDKIRVWMNFDGKICFRNTKTGNEISVEPYYDMEGNTYNE